MAEVEFKLDEVLEELQTLNSVLVQEGNRIDKLESGLDTLVTVINDKLKLTLNAATSDVGDNRVASPVVNPVEVEQPRLPIINPTQQLQKTAHLPLRQARRLHSAVVNESEGNVSPALSVDVQDEFKVIKDALQKVKLPKDLKLDESKQGVKRSELQKANIIAKAASYSETLLKLLLTLEPGSILSAGDLDDLITIVTAEIRYLQEERGQLLVNSSLGPGVAGLYRNFRRNTTLFPPEALDALSAAVALHSSNSNSASQGDNSARYRDGYRGRISWVISWIISWESL
jgi:hypothetical protein